MLSDLFLTSRLTVLYTLIFVCGLLHLPGPDKGFLQAETGRQGIRTPLVCAGTRVCLILYRIFTFTFKTFHGAKYGSIQAQPAIPPSPVWQAHFSVNSLVIMDHTIIS